MKKINRIKKVLVIILCTIVFFSISFNYNVDAAEQTTVVCIDTGYYATGGCFNTTSGTFIATETGFYEYHTDIYNYTGNGRAVSICTINGVKVADYGTWVYDNSVTASQITTKYFYVTKGQTVNYDIKISSGGGYQYSDATHVTAYIRTPAKTFPQITVISPQTNSTYSSNSNFDTLTIAGTVNDSNYEETIKVYYRIDGIEGQSGVQIGSDIISDNTSKAFDMDINTSTLSEGNHILYVWAEDSTARKSSIVNIPFKIDKTIPQIGSLTVTSTSSSINISSSVTDEIAGLDISPYRYTIGTNEPTAWLANSSYTQENLLPNKQYNIIFEVKDAVGNIATSTGNIYTKAIAPNINVNNLASYSCNIGISDDNPINTQYQISVNDGEKYITPEGILTTSPVWITLPSKNITITGLNPSTTYTFTAKAKNGEDVETAWSAPVSGTTLIQPPNAPVNMTAVATSNSISVVWDPVASSNGYDIEVDGSIIDNGTCTSYSHTGLTPYTQHTYRVRAKNEGGIGAWSELMSKYTQQDTPNTPFNIDAAATNTSIIVTWQPIPGATAYDIEVDGVVVNNSSSTNYVHTGLLSGTMHSYRVRSINSGGKSEWSNEILVSTLTDAPIVPSNLTATPASGQITVAWDAIPGATYEIEVDGNIKDNGTSNSFVHTALLSGSSHSYRVRTNKSGSLSDWSAVVIATIPVEEFGTPKNIKAEATDTTVTISWSPVVDATGYEVEVDGVVLDNATDTVCIHNGLTPNTQHSYRVRAVGTDQVSEWSEPMAVTTYALPTPTNINTVALHNSINITWDVVADATSYELDIDGQLIEVTTNTYTHDGLTSNSQHSYRIRAKNTSGNSNWSTTIKQTTMISGLNAPQSITALAKSTAITVLWNPVEGATSYEIEADGVVIPDVLQARYTNTGLQAGSTHTYRVRAKKDGVTTDWSQPITVSTISNGPAIPNNLIGSASTSSILLTWDKVDNATEYELEVDGSVINVGAGTKYLHTGLAPDSQHTYRVRAKNISETSAWSQLATIKTASSINTFAVDNEINEVFNLIFTAANIENPTQYTYTITYNSNELELLDLCSFTSRIDLGTGNIIGTDIQIAQFEPGIIVFKKLGTANGQAWNGFVNSIKFRSKVNGISNVSYRYE